MITRLQRQMSTLGNTMDVIDRLTVLTVGREISFLFHHIYSIFKSGAQNIQALS